MQSLDERAPIVIVPLDESIAGAAAGLRAAHPKLRLPDALVVATAEERSAEQLVTTDRGWPTARVLKLGAKIVTI